MRKKQQAPDVLPDESGIDELSLSEETLAGKSPYRRAIISGVVTGLLLITFFVVRWYWLRPLGPKLTISTESLDRGSGIDNAERPETVESEQMDAPASSAPYCGGPPVMYLMIVGKDTLEYEYNIGDADAIRLVRVDFVYPSITILPIPRDLLVPIPGMADHGVGSNRIKTAYAYGNRYLGPGGGPSLLAETLLVNFDAQVDHYAVANFDAFKEGIDAVGGVDLYFDEAFDVDEDGTVEFLQGMNHLDGEAALSYARARPEDATDLYRIGRQTELIKAIQVKLLSPQLFPSLPRLIRSISALMLTDLSPSDISNLLCIMQRVEPDYIQSISLEKTMYSSEIDQNGYEYLRPDIDAISVYIVDFEAGELSALPDRSD
ncbi:MAG: LCP family protein [Anaerolineae bacterium]|nr:LCP family protein [Anaerolineae bacterium]